MVVLASVIEIIRILIFLLIVALAIVNQIIMFVWKRSDVSVLDFFTLGLPGKHKGLCWWKQPELYFKEDRAQLARLLLSSFFILLLIACLLVFIP